MDLRCALRQGERSPGFVALSLTILTVGLTATLALFGLLDAIVLKTLPVVNLAQLVGVDAVDPEHPFESGHLLPPRWP